MEALKATGLRCEDAIRPDWVESVAPRLSWVLEDDRRDQCQTAWHVLAASEPSQLREGRADRWDSGRVTSPRTVGIRYGGPPLASRELCYWTVRVWDRDGEPGPWAEPTSFEMALLEPSEWLGDWLGYPAGWPGHALYFRSGFRLEQPVLRARAYVAAIGYHELRLNGSKVGDHVLDPAWTAYDRRVSYVVHDISAHIRHGDNAVGVIVGAGWYGMPKLLIQLEFDLADGTRMTVASSEEHGQWNVATGPILENSVYEGEVVDARHIDPGWDTPEYRIAPWIVADKEAWLGEEAGTRVMTWEAPNHVESPGGRLVPQSIEPIRVVETRALARLDRRADGRLILDTGQNLSGWVRTSLEAAAGTGVTLRYGELLTADGELDQGTLVNARSTDRYTCRGGGPETYEPRFTYHGFRYVEVAGPSREELDGARFDVRVVRSDTTPRGTFHCSDPLLERIHRMVWWSEATNQHGVPTDCPQRNERMGWLNDLPARAEQAMLNFDLRRFMRKWLIDIEDTQDPASGAIADTAPYRLGHRPAEPAASALLDIPWLLYVIDGDEDVLPRTWPSMRAWVDCLLSLTDADGILHHSVYGDWIEPSGDPGRLVEPAWSERTPNALVSTAALAAQAARLSAIGLVIGETDAAERYAAEAARVRAAFIAAFVDDESGLVGTGSQGSLAIALGHGLVPDDQVASVVAALVDDVERHDRHHTTGEHSLRHLLEVLATHGRPDLALAIVRQQPYPGYGYMLDHGATTLWERWEPAAGGDMNSRNHPVHGTVDAFLYRHVAGLVPDPDGPGFSRFSVRPRVTAWLDAASASIETVRGRAAVAWERRPAGLTIEVEVPVGSVATVWLPRPHGAGAADVVVTERGRPVWPSEGPVDGVRRAFASERSVVVEVGSGRYALAIAAAA